MSNNEQISVGAVIMLLLVALLSLSSCSTRTEGRVTLSYELGDKPDSTTFVDSDWYDFVTEVHGSQALVYFDGNYLLPAGWYEAGTHVDTVITDRFPGYTYLTYTITIHSVY